MTDIGFVSGEYRFSYRIAGIVVQNGCVLLQKPEDDDGYAFPGGQAAFGETNEETLVREFREEIGAGVSVKALRWAEEVFFRWNERKCQQICLYYECALTGNDVPMEGEFMGIEDRGPGKSRIRFYWIPLERLPQIKVYPSKAGELLKTINQGVHHFVTREE